MLDKTMDTPTPAGEDDHLGPKLSMCQARSEKDKQEEEEMEQQEQEEEDMMLMLTLTLAKPHQENLPFKANR